MLHRTAVALLLAASLSCSARTAAPPPEPPEPQVVQTNGTPRYSASAFYETTTVFGASFSPDGSHILFTSDDSGVFNAHSIPVTGGPGQQITQSTTDPHYAVGWFPDGERVLVAADQGGNELTHLYAVWPDGTTRDLTPGEGAKADFGRWSNDKSHFWVWTNERDARYFDAYRYRTADFTREMVFQNDEGWTPGPISQDGRWFALRQVNSNNDSDLYLYDAQSPGKPPRHISPHEGDATHTALTFVPNRQVLVYNTNAHGEFDQAWAYDMKTGQHSPQFSASWDVMYVKYSKNGRYVVVGTNEDARTRVVVSNTETGDPVVLPDLPTGDVRGVVFSDAEDRMAFFVAGEQEPSNLYNLDLEGQGYRKLTDTLSPTIDANHLVVGEVVRYPSFDGLEIPSILYRPHDATADAPVPAIVWVHGGPGGQSRLGYNALRQFLVNQGYALLAINNRGSSGYGKTFFHADDRQHGDVDLQDCVFARHYLESLDWVDGERVAIMGGSYGGYLTVAALAFSPDTFAAGIDIFGVTNWVRTLESIPPYWASFRRYLYDEIGDPAVDGERLRAISPLFHASNITKPLMVVQGANDPRVLQIESDEIVAAAKANGVPVTYLVFEDEGHGFRSRKNRVTAASAYASFLVEHLGR